MSLTGNLSWKKFLTLTLAVYLLSTSSAFADTYNLYFKKAGPEKETAHEEVTTDSEEESTTKPNRDLQREREAEELKEQNAEEARRAQEAQKAAKAAAIKAQEEADQRSAAAERNVRNEDSHSSKVVIPNEVKGAPTTIIINNNLNAPAKVESAEPPPRASVEPLPLLRPEATAETATVAFVPVRPSPFKMGLSATVFSTRVDAPWSNSFSQHTVPGTGLMLTTGFDITRWMAINAWGGIAPDGDDVRFYGGADVEFLPLRLNMGSYNLLELGVLTGVSTLSYAATSKVGPVHLGGRFSLNFNEHFGLTTSLRANRTFVMWEGGFVARL